MSRFTAGLSLVIAAASLSPLPAFAQNDRAERFIRETMASRHLPSVTMAVIKDGRVIDQAAFGTASVELNVPATVSTVYPIASATKAFATELLMMLVEEHKLELTDTLGALLPDLPEAWTGIPLSRAMSHTSGLPDIALVPGRGPLVSEDGDSAMVKLRTMPMQFRPGEKWSYNQTNYMLIKRIIERITGDVFEAQVRHRIFEPIGMTSTAFGDGKDVIPGRATAYEADKTGKLTVRRVDFPPYVRAAAGINTNVVDWSKWLIALTSGSLLKPESKAELWTAVKLNDGSVFRLGKQMGYGGGYVVDDTPGFRWIGHSGGGTAAFRYFLDQKIGFVVLTNGTMDPDALLAGIAKAYLPDLP
ncbi:MAG: serine hydrolase domain-containing protein [Gemmatimonadota bacterium]